MQRIGIIDLGSNTSRLIVMEYQPHHSFKLLDEVSRPVRLAEGSGADNILQPEPMRRAVEALKMFTTFCRSTGVDEIMPVATSALREAANQADFLHMLHQEVDLDLRILDGEEEAYYGYLGVINSLPFTDGYVVDIGGGSTEVTAVQGRAVDRSVSKPAGVVRFTEQYVQSDPIGKKDLRALKEGVEEMFADLDWMEMVPGRKLVGLGGTVRTLARIEQKKQNYPLDRKHGYVLTRDALDAIVDEVCDKDFSDRKDISGLSSDRADVIVAGAVIMQHLMHRSGFDEMLISGQGLREGLFYDHFLVEHRPPVFSDTRGFGVQSLAYIYNYEVLHCEKVRDLALSLFDQLRDLHGYGEWERELLSHAALLHDIGVAVGYYDHHKHGAYLVFNASLPGFEHREIVILAALVRNHRKGQFSVDEYTQVLTGDDPERIAKLSSFLRIAEYLERSKSQVVQSLKAVVKDNKVVVSIRAVGDASVELWDANRRSNLFRKAFDYNIEIISEN